MVWRSHHTAINDIYRRFLCEKASLPCDRLCCFCPLQLRFRPTRRLSARLRHHHVARSLDLRLCGIRGNICLPEKGGFYPTIGGDAIFHRRFGIGGDISWRGGQGNYAGLGVPYRPIIFDINGVYQPRIGKKAGLDLVAGIGWQTTRFYSFNNSTNCIYFSACYNSYNHFLVDLGAGVRYYVWGHVFVRPEARYYHVLNNTNVFTSGNIVRVGASIGYTIGPD